MVQQASDVVWGEFYAYSATIAAIPTTVAGVGLAYTTVEIRIDSDADFQFLKTSYYSTNDNAECYIRFKDDTVGRYLMKTADSSA